MGKSPKYKNILTHIAIHINGMEYHVTHLYVLIFNSSGLQEWKLWWYFNTDELVKSRKINNFQATSQKVAGKAREYRGMKSTLVVPEKATTYWYYYSFTNRILICYNCRKFGKRSQNRQKTWDLKTPVLQKHTATCFAPDWNRYWIENTRCMRWRIRSTGKIRLTLEPCLPKNTADRHYRPD